MSPDHQVEKLAYMANQIAAFFASRPEDEAITEIANHLTKFWEPRMRAKIIDYAARENHQLTARAAAAVHRIGTATKH